MHQYTISDIHGCAATFKALLQQINFSKEDELYLLGDYIDRGPDSKGVIDHIWALQASGHQVFCLRGNHEELLINASADMHQKILWAANGGTQTLESFGVTHHLHIPKSYIAWITELPFFFEVGNYILVHAGFNFRISDPFQDKETMLWIRHWYPSLNREWLKERIIIHGHTPMPKTEIEQMHRQLDDFPVLDIDGGCTFVERNYGWLCALELGTKTLYFERNCDPVKKRNR
jgi:serine/threonine protein phosphatase 1